MPSKKNNPVAEKQPNIFLQIWKKIWSGKKKPGAVTKKRKYKMGFAVGVSVVALALVGAISLVVLGINAIHLLQDDSKQREEIQSVVAMAVNMDPMPFESVEKADKNFLLNISAWTALAKLDKSTLQTTEEGNLLLPESDVEVAFKTLFGTDQTLDYQPTSSEDNVGSLILYDSKTKSYLIPPTAYVTSVVPVIPSDSKLINREGKTYVKVGYSSNSLTGGAAEDETASVYKYMTYVLSREKDHYVISAVLEYNDADFE